MTTKAARKDYADRTDLEKIQSQWNKTSGLHDREESSSAIVRAATAAEIAANYAIRQEFAKRSQFSADFVDSLLIWANGLDGKLNRLLVPLCETPARRETMGKLKAAAAEINKARNAIVHQGHFSDPKPAQKIIEHTRSFVETLVRLYEKDFVLLDKSS